MVGFMQDIINYDEALDRLGGDEEFLVELLGELSNQINENLKEVESKLAEQDFEGIGRIGHGLKGASANLEVTGIAQLSAQLEKSVIEKNSEKVQSLVERIKQGNEELKKFLLDF